MDIQRAGYPLLPAPQTRGAGDTEECEKCIATETDAEPLVGTWVGGRWVRRGVPRSCPGPEDASHRFASPSSLRTDFVLPLPGARVSGHVCNGRTVTTVRQW